MLERAEYTNNVLTVYDAVASPPRGTSPWELFSKLSVLSDPGAGFRLHDDFFDISTGATSRWQVVKGTGGSLALSTALQVGGAIDIPTAGSSANDYQTLASPVATYLLAANKHLIFEVSLLLTEANTNTASWFAGLTSTTTTGFISNAGAPPSSYSGAMFWKATGGMSLKFQTSNSTTQNTVTIGTVVSGTNYVLGAYLDPNDGTTGKVTPYVSSVSTGVRSLVAIGATQNLALGSLAKMYLMFGVKTGSTSAETLTVDYASIMGVR